MNLNNIFRFYCFNHLFQCFGISMSTGVNFITRELLIEKVRDADGLLSLLTDRIDKVLDARKSE